MKKLLILIAISGLTYAEGDPGGWSKAKWGMDTTKIAKAFGGSIPEVTQIGNKDYKLGYDFDGKGGLQRVVLTMDSIGGGHFHYNKVFELMLQKYGKPERGDKAQSMSKGYAMWKFKSTIIIITLSGNNNPNRTDSDPLDFFTIEYRKSSYVEKDAENL